MDIGEFTTDEEIEDCEDIQAPLIPVSEVVSAFLEEAFGTKLENKVRVAKAKAQGTHNSQWIRCSKINPVVMVNATPAARMADRVASQLQQFWLDAASPLVIFLEKAEVLDLPKEVINTIQMALQLMGNANYHYSTARRQALVLQLNPKLKQLFPDGDFRDAALYLFGDNFGRMAKKHLEAADKLKKGISSDNRGQQGFQRSHPQRNSGCGGGSQCSSPSGGSRGW